jgi:hypothetical protein
MRELSATEEVEFRSATQSQREEKRSDSINERHTGVSNFKDGPSDLQL